MKSLLIPLLVLAGVDAQTLLDKHIEWLGGRGALAKAQTVVFNGTLYVAGLEGEIATIFHRDGFAWIAFDLGVTNGIECVNPVDAWTRNGNGDVADLDADRIKAHRRGLSRTLCTHLLRTDDTVLSVQDDLEAFGDTWPALRFTYPDGDFVELYLDENNGACVGMRNVQGVDTLMVGLSKWDTVEGRRFAFVQRQSGSLPEQNLGMVWDSIELNPEVDTSVFDRPDSTKGYIR